MTASPRKTFGATAASRHITGIILSVFMCLSSAVSAAWTNSDGHEIAGKPVAFDFNSKVFTFRDPITKEERPVPAGDLSLHSRQRLLLSPVFLQAESEGDLWPSEKRALALRTAAVVAIFFLLALWISAFALLRKWNPVLALAGFAGTWIVLGILAACYLFLQQRFGGDTRILYMGGAVTLAITPLFLSSVYACSYFKSHLLLYLHVAAGLLLLLAAVYLGEWIVGKEKAVEWWDREVFAPAGLSVAPADRTNP